MSVLTGLTDGVLDPQRLEQVRVSSRRQRRPRPELKESAQKRARQLLEEGRVTDRDYQLLETLYNATQVLSRHQIQRLFWQGDSPSLSYQVSNRLRRLVDYHVLDQNPNATVEMATAGLEPCYVYFIGTVGVSLLALQRGVARKEIRRPRAYRGLSAPIMLIHDLLVAEVYTRLRRQTAPTATQIRWIAEWQASMRNNQGAELVRPDALIVLHREEHTRYAFLEVERHASPGAMREKVVKYEAAMREGVWRGRFGLQTFPDVMLVLAGGRRESIGAVIGEHSRNVRWHVRDWPFDDFFSGWELTSR